MSQPTFIGTPQAEWALGSDTNATLTAGPYTLKVPTITEPTSDLPNGSIVVPAPGRRNFTKFQFFGTDADDERFSVRIWRWQRRRTKQAGLLWMPIPILTVTDLRLNSALLGVTAQKPSDVDFMADEFASVAGDSNRRTLDNVDIGPAEIVLDGLGCFLWEVEGINGTAPTAASFNFLFVGD